MNRKEITMRRRTAVILALLLSVLLFAAGLYSGLHVSKSVEKQSQQDIQRLEQRQQAEADYLVEYVNTLENDLQKFQLQELFISSLDNEDACKLAEAYFNQTAESLSYYWSVLPVRLETYERENELNADYLALKQRYTKLSLRAWLISKKNYEECKTTVVPLLYFYSADCEECEKQGKELDKLHQHAEERGIAALAFTIDINAKEPALDLVKQYYGVSETPAIIVNNTVLQGRVFSEEEISALI